MSLFAQKLEETSALSISVRKLSMLLFPALLCVATALVPCTAVNVEIITLLPYDIGMGSAINLNGPAIDVAVEAVNWKYTNS